MHFVHSFQWPHHDLEFADLSIPYLNDINTVDLNVVDRTGELKHGAAAIDRFTHVAKVITEDLTRCAQV